MLTDYFLAALFSILTGFIGGYAGIGGGVLLIFLFTAVMQYPQHLAQGTVMAILLGPITLTGLLVMRKRIKPLMIYAVIGIISYPLFSFLGSVFAYKLPGWELSILFALFLIAIGVYNFIYTLVRKEKPAKPLLKLNYFYMFVLCCLVGFAGGLLGIGAGVLLVPFLIWIFNLDKDDARTLSFMVL